MVNQDFKFNLVEQEEKEHKQELLHLLGFACDVFDHAIYHDMHERNDNDNEDDTAAI